MNNRRTLADREHYLMWLLAVNLIQFQSNNISIMYMYSVQVDITMLVFSFFLIS